MAVMTGGTKIATRAAFNDALGFNKLTDDYKTVVVNDVYNLKNSFVNGSTTYNVYIVGEECSSCGHIKSYDDPESGSKWVCGDCAYTNQPANRLYKNLKCENIEIVAVTDPTIRFYVNIGAKYFDPDIVNVHNGAWERQGGGEYTCIAPLKIEGLDSNGSRIFYEDVDVTFNAMEDGGYDGAVLYGASGSFVISTKKSAPLRTLIVVDVYYPVAGISIGNYYNVTGSSSTNSVYWYLGFEIGG